MNAQITVDQAMDPKWKSLYKAGGAGALLIGTFLLVEMVAYIATAAPSLADAAGWFSLFHANRFIGLIDFGILELYALVLFVPLYLALYLVLRRASESYMAIAATLAFIGIAVNFATNKLFSLLTLSDLYAASTTAAMRSQFLAAGQATLALGALGGIGGSVEGGIPLAIAGLIISVIMLRSNLLGRAAGYLGILANGTGLVMVFNAALAPAMTGSPFFLVFFLFSVAWFFLVGQKLLRLK
ncbi:MAG TPA: DUF4386 family protein [Anaerolineales bacterium]